MRKLLFIFLALAVLGSGLWFAIDRLVEDGQAGRDRPLSQTKVRKRTIEKKLTFLGEITPARLVDIRSEVSGRAEEVNMKAGMRVKQGDLLVRLDERLLQTEKKQLMVDISTSRLKIGIAKRNYKELKELGKDFAARHEVLNKEAELHIAENDIERLDMRLNEIEEKLRKVRIESPIDGTILGVGIQKWQVVVGAEASSGGTTIAQVADLDRLMVNGEVNQVDISSLKKGMMGWASSILDEDISIPCELIGVSPVAIKNDDGSRNFKVRLLLKGQSSDLRPGMSTRITFPVQKVEKTLSVPVQAVFSEKGKHVIYKVDAQGEIQKTPVEVGLAGVSFVQILSGVKLKEIVLLENPDDEASVAPQGRHEVEKSKNGRSNSRDKPKAKSKKETSSRGKATKDKKSKGRS